LDWLVHFLTPSGVVVVRIDLSRDMAPVGISPCCSTDCISTSSRGPAASTYIVVAGAPAGPSRTALAADEDVQMATLTDSAEIGLYPGFADPGSSIKDEIDIAALERLERQVNAGANALLVCGTHRAKRPI